MTFFLIIIFVILLHALYNLINYIRYPNIEKKLLYSYSSDPSEKTLAMSYKIQIVNYIKYSGVKDKYVVVTQPSGYGQLASSKVSVLNNLNNPREDIAANAINCLLEAKGNYWTKFINSFNPFYWLRIIIFLPKHIFTFIGLNEESMVIKIFQIIYWLLSVTCTFFITVFPDEIKSFLSFHY